jgi:hypothetical protein
MPLLKHFISSTVTVARFARDCLAKFAEVIGNLELSLGEGTSELSMRYGMHSAY